MSTARSVLRGLRQLPRELTPPAPERAGTGLAIGAPRVLAAAARGLRGGRRQALVDLGGAKAEVDLRTAHGRRLYAFGFGEPAARALRALVAPGDVVIDAGANIGLFTLQAAIGVGADGRVLACEPAPATLALLRANVERNHLPWVSVHDVALADAPGRLTLRVFEPGSGYSSFAPEDAGAASAVEVEVTTLDDLAGPLLPRVRVLKIDIEGAELRALQGATRLLAQARPDIIIELEPDHLERQGASLDAVQALLEAAGYAGYAIGPRGLTPLPGSWQPGAGGPNIVVRPRER